MEVVTEVELPPVLGRTLPTPLFTGGPAINTEAPSSCGDKMEVWPPVGPHNRGGCPLSFLVADITLSP